MRLLIISCHQGHIILPEHLEDMEPTIAFLRSENILLLLIECREIIYTFVDGESLVVFLSVCKKLYHEEFLPNPIKKYIRMEKDIFTALMCHGNEGDMKNYSSSIKEGLQIRVSSNYGIYGENFDELASYLTSWVPQRQLKCVYPFLTIYERCKRHFDVNTIIWIICTQVSRNIMHKTNFANMNISQLPIPPASLNKISRLMKSVCLNIPGTKAIFKKHKAWIALKTTSPSRFFSCYKNTCHTVLGAIYHLF